MAANHNGKEKGKVFLNREGILEVNDRPVEELEVPEWGCWVRIRALDALTMQKLTSAFDGASETRIHVLMAAASLVDEEGNALFSLDDVSELEKKRFEAIQRISGAAMRLSRSRPQDMEAFQENFPETQAESLPSA